MQTQNITLDFCRNDYKTITVKQYDKDSRNLLITCTDNGVVYKLDSSTQECNVKMNTPDNRAIYNAATINEDGKVFITFDENMVYDSGTGQLEIHIIEQSTKRTLSSMILTVIIVGSVYSDDKIIASDEFNALTDALLGIDEAYQKASEAVEAAQEVTDRVEKFEEQSVRAETVREQNEQLRQENTTKAINAANAATTSATQATSSANTAASQAREATTRLEQLERQVEQTETVREQNEQQRKETAVRAENAASAATSAANAANNAVTKAQEAANRVEQLEDQIEQAESVREQNEQKRQSNTSQAVSASNAAASAANQATSNANKAAQNANTATDRANAAAEACEGVVLGAGLIPVAEKGAAGGVATLDSDGTLTDSQMPSLIYEKSGTTLTLEDSVDGGLKIDRICGGSKQETTSGNQLLPLVERTETKNGLTLTIEGGTISVKGTPTNTTAHTVFELGKINLKAGTYTHRTDNKVVGVGVAFHNNDAGVLNFSMSATITTRTQTLASDLETKVVINVDNTKGEVNYSGNWMLNAGTEAIPWEPYTGGIPSPNPKYQQPIVSAGQMLVDGVVSDVGISKKLTGKNLHDSSFRNDSGVVKSTNGTATETGGVYSLVATKADAYIWEVVSVGLLYNSNCGQLISIPNNADNITISLSNNAFNKNRVTFFDENKVSLGYYPYNTNVFTIDVPDGAKYFTVRFGIENSVSDTTYETTVMVEYGPVATEYEPYTEQTLTLNHVLRGIPVTDVSLANCTDENGKMWCADYIDADRGMLVERTGVIESYNGETIATNYLSTTGELTIGSKVIYELATPIETPLTDEEIIALHQLKTYQGVTHIFGSNDPAPTLEVEYGASRVGALSLENSNLHAVNEVLRGQMLTHSDVVDNLTSTDADVPLSANQGRKLDESLGKFVRDLVHTQTINTSLSDSSPVNIVAYVDNLLKAGTSVNCEVTWSTNSALLIGMKISANRSRYIFMPRTNNNIYVLHKDTTGAFVMNQLSII